ncbi:MAG: sugar ABC transporter ATP-binding protein [Alphaproteobacteria bacterium]
MSDAATPLIECIGIGKTFGGVVALEGVDFTLMPGEVHGLVGENGAGKSTLMKIIAGVHHEYQGTMRVEGNDVHFRSAREALDAGIGMVHQELSIVPSLTVAENVFLGVQPVNRLGTVSWREMARRAAEHLHRLGIDVNPKAEAGDLPLGQQQLVELGRVLFSGARMIILDEPTSALSPPEVEVLFAVLRKLKAEGTSFIFISHFLEDVLEISDRVTVFRNSRRVGTAHAADIGKLWLIEQMIGTGHEGLGEAYTGEIPLHSPPGAQAVMVAENLGQRGNFRDVSFHVDAGEVLGIYGFMGSGQLELAKALNGKTRLDRGTVSVDGRRLRLRNTASAWKNGVALVPESRRSMLFGAEPVYKNVSISILDRIDRIFLRPSKERAIAKKLVEALRVRPRSTEAELRTLSGGNQQKVALARWLTHLPRVLILSEPTRGMDVGAKDDVVNIVKGLKDQGIAVIVVSAEPETVLSLADRILVMRKGLITYEFANVTVSKDRLLAAA